MRKADLFYMQSNLYGYLTFLEKKQTYFKVQLNITPNIPDSLYTEGLDHVLEREN